MSAVASPATLALFAPPMVLREDEKLQLGQRVLYTHRAVVVRWWWRDRENKAGGSEWVVREGANRQFPPRIMRTNETLPLEGPDDPFYDRPIKGLTKTVFMFPDEGEAVVTGFVRRGIGRSQKGHYSGFEYPEYEEGYFEPLGYAKLYVIRWHLSGTAYGLVPFWAARRAPTFRSES